MEGKVGNVVAAVLEDEFLGCHKQLVKIEHAVHHPPLLVARGVGGALLEGGNKRLPLLLTGKRGQAGHGAVPVEIEGSLNNHEESVAKNINLHLQDTHTLDALFYLWPEMLAAVSLAVFLDEFAVVAQLHGLAIALHGTMIFFHTKSFCHNSFYVWLGQTYTFFFKYGYTLAKRLD